MNKLTVKCLCKFFGTSLFFALHIGNAVADNYQIYFPMQSDFDAQTRELPPEKQKVYIVNTDSNVVQVAPLTQYLTQAIRPFSAPTYSTSTDFMGSTRVVQDFIGSELIIRDNNLVTVGDLTPNSGIAYQFDRVARINVVTGEVTRSYLVARSQEAYQAALDSGYVANVDVVLSDGAGDLPGGATPITFRTFSQNTTTQGGAVETGGGFFAEEMTAADGTSLVRRESDGTLHFGENSVVISTTGLDRIHSSVGELHIGNSGTHRTIINGTLEIQDPTQPNHAATKRYVDSSAAMSMAIASLPRAMGSDGFLGFGVGHQGGQSAIAFGLSRNLMSNSAQLNLSIGYNAVTKTSIGAGMGWRY